MNAMYVTFLVNALYILSVYSAYSAFPGIFIKCPKLLIFIRTGFSDKERAGAIRIFHRSWSRDFWFRKDYVNSNNQCEPRNVNL